METSNRITLKTSLEVHRIRKACLVVQRLLEALSEIIKPGITTAQVNDFAERFIGKLHAKASQKGYRGFPAGICTSVNSVAAHGVPGLVVLEEGDLLTVDATVSVDGWHGDGAWTYIVGQDIHGYRNLVNAAWRIMMAGILAAKAGNRLGDIGYSIGKAASACKVKVLEDFAGHGIGLHMHEDPIVLHCGSQGIGQPLVPGMVLTVEPIITPGVSKTKLLDDGWSVVTADSAPTAQFEQTLALFGDRTEILTQGDILEYHLDGPPFF